MSNNSNNTSVDQHSALQFPPIPLASGDAILDAQGHMRPIRSMTVTATTEDGDKIEVPLEFRLGGWWPPVPPVVWTEVAG